jgi:hypothetical protein
MGPVTHSAPLSSYTSFPYAHAASYLTKTYLTTLNHIHSKLLKNIGEEKSERMSKSQVTRTVEVRLFAAVYVFICVCNFAFLPSITQAFVRSQCRRKGMPDAYFSLTLSYMYTPH